MSENGIKNQIYRQEEAFRFLGQKETLIEKLEKKKSIDKWDIFSPKTWMTSFIYHREDWNEYLRKKKN